jgi:hypothetical protein
MFSINCVDINKKLTFPFCLTTEAKFMSSEDEKDSKKGFGEIFNSGNKDESRKSTSLHEDKTGDITDSNGNISGSRSGETGLKQSS